MFCSNCLCLVMQAKKKSQYNTVTEQLNVCFISNLSYCIETLKLSEQMRQAGTVSIFGGFVVHAVGDCQALGSGVTNLLYRRKTSKCLAVPLWTVKGVS